MSSFGGRKRIICIVDASAQPREKCLISELQWLYRIMMSMINWWINLLWGAETFSSRRSSDRKFFELRWRGGWATNEIINLNNKDKQLFPTKSRPESRIWRGRKRWKNIYTRRREEGATRQIERSSFIFKIPARAIIWALNGLRNSISREHHSALNDEMAFPLLAQRGKKRCAHGDFTNFHNFHHRSRAFSLIRKLADEKGARRLRSGAKSQHDNETSL